MQEVTPDKLKELLDDGQTVFLKLWQKGCGPCKLSEGATKRMEESDQFKGLLFAKISTDEHPEMVETAGTDILPVFFLFKNKKLIVLRYL